MKKKVKLGEFTHKYDKFIPEEVGDEIEGSFLAVAGTFRDMGIRVVEGTSSPTSFSFFLEMNAKKRWYLMAKTLLTDHRGYILRIGKMLMLHRDDVRFQWMVSIEADNILLAADNFRRALYFTWDLVKRSSVYNIEVPNEEDGDSDEGDGA